MVVLSMMFSWTVTQIPNYMIISWLGINNNYLALILPAALNGYATNLQDVLPADQDLFNDQVVFNQVDIGKEDSVYLFQSNSAEMVLANTYM